MHNRKTAAKIDSHELFLVVLNQKYLLILTRDIQKSSEEPIILPSSMLYYSRASLLLPPHSWSWLFFWMPPDVHSLPVHSLGTPRGSHELLFSDSRLSSLPIPKNKMLFFATNQRYRHDLRRGFIIDATSYIRQTKSESYGRRET